MRLLIHPDVEVTQGRYDLVSQNCWSWFMSFQVHL
jgi:hypothetical protein